MIKSSDIERLLHASHNEFANSIRDEVKNLQEENKRLSTTVYKQRIVLRFYAKSIYGDRGQKARESLAFTEDYE